MADEQQQQTTQPATQVAPFSTGSLSQPGVQVPTADTSALSPTGQQPAPTTAPNPQTGVQPVQVKPGTPHAPLVNMIQSLALGVDAFATAAATKGREGGVEEVQNYFAKQQQQKIEAQRAQQEESEHDLRMKTMNANLLMQQMQYQHALMRFPIELKNDQLKLQNDTIDEFTKEKGTGESMGYDMADPAQAQEARFRMGLGSADQQPGAISVPFTGKQNTGDVMQALSAALPPGKSLTDYKIMPSYNDDAHGTGGKLVAVPNNAPIMTMPATPRQIQASNAEVQGMIEKGQALGMDKDPAFASLQGQFENMKNTLLNGGKPTTSQLFQMHQSVIGPLSKMVADKSDAAKLQEQQETLQKETIAGQQLRAANNAYQQQVPKDANGNPTMSFASWQDMKNKQIEQSITEGKPEDTGKALASGLLTLADLKSRGSNPGQILRAIQAAERQTQNQNINASTNTDVNRVMNLPYNPSDEVVGEQALKNITNQTFFGSARSLVQKGGVLDQLVAAHQGIGGTSIPKFNSWENFLEWHTGSPQQAAYKAAVLGAADDYSKVVAGGNPTDSSRTQTAELFLPALNTGQIDAAVQQARMGVRSQVKGRIGDNRYLMQREGDTLGPVGEGQQAGAPPGADVQVKGSDNKTYWGNSRTKQIIGPVQ